MLKYFFDVVRRRISMDPDQPQKKHTDKTDVLAELITNKEKVPKRKIMAQSLILSTVEICIT